MGRDPYKRAYLFEIEVGGLTLVECDRITGISMERGNFAHVDGNGREIPLTGGFKMTTLEIHNPSQSSNDFFTWYSNQDPERKSGSIIVKDQAGNITQTATFSDMIPKGMSLDDLDRKTEDKHGSTYRVDCVIRSIS